MHPKLGQASRRSGSGNSCSDDVLLVRRPRSWRQAGAAPSLGGDAALAASEQQREHRPILSVSLPARRAAAAGLEASSRAPRQASSTALPRLPGKRCSRPLRGGHSISNSIERIAAGSRSPSTANASTILPPAWRTVASGNGTAVSASAGLLREFAQRRLGGRLAGLDHALGNHPGARILIAPERAAGLDQQDFDRRHPAAGTAGCPRYAAAASTALCRPHAVSAIEPPPSSRVPS